MNSNVPIAGINDVLKDGANQTGSFFEQVVMSSPAIIAAIRGEDMGIVFGNNLFKEHFGYAEDSFAGIAFTSIIDAQQHDRFRRQLAEVAAIRGSTLPFVIYKLRNADGSWQTFYIYASLIVGAHQSEMFQLLILPDRSLWGMPFTSFETRELFLEHFSADSFGTFEWIRESDEVFSSAGLYKIFEIAQDGKKIDSRFATAFLHSDDAERVKKGIADVLESGGDLATEFRIVTAADNVKVIHCLSRVIKDANGEILKVAGSIRDVTAQRTIDHNLKNKVEELRRSNRELEEFAYAASHDLQEPLRKITTFSDRLVEKYKASLAGEGEMYISRMVTSAENMRQLINGLLEFSKISQPAAPYERVDLNDVLHAVMTDLELKIEETGTAIRTTGLPTVDAVASQMKQLFMNLIGNAIKFHKEGAPPIIKIEVCDVADEELRHHDLQVGKRYYKIEITDNGIGFESEYATRIFQVFQRLHGKSEYPGSGIGLAICQKILAYHNGVIYAENVPDTGARFVFILPENQN